MVLPGRLQTQMFINFFIHYYIITPNRPRRDQGPGRTLNSYLGVIYCKLWIKLCTLVSVYCSCNMYADTSYNHSKMLPGSKILTIYIHASFSRITQRKNIRIISDTAASFLIASPFHAVPVGQASADHAPRRPPR
jgi:hypothetical protein